MSNTVMNEEKATATKLCSESYFVAVESFTRWFKRTNPNVTAEEANAKYNTKHTHRCSVCNNPVPLLFFSLDSDVVEVIVVAPHTPDGKLL